MTGKIEWIEVRGSKSQPIGAVGFIGNDAVAIVSFFEDADFNKDGSKSLGELMASKMLLNLSGRAVVEVAQTAQYQPEILMRDASISRMAASMFLNFAQGLVAQGIYSAYFARGVSLVGRAIATRVTDNAVKQFVVRKGFEAAVKQAMQPGLNR